MADRGYDPLTGGAVPVDKKISRREQLTEGVKTHTKIPRVHIPSPAAGSTTPKTLFLIVVYMFMLGMVTMAFQSVYASNQEFAEFEDTYGSFNPGLVLQGDVGWNAVTPYMLGDYFGKEFNLEEYQYKEFVQRMRINWDEDMDARRHLETYVFYTRLRLPVPGETQLWMEEHTMQFAENEVARIKRGDWLGSIGRFFGSITDAWGFVIGLATMNFYPSIALPLELTWIPFFMMLPVWIYLGWLLAPFAIAAINAIGNLIPFT